MAFEIQLEGPISFAPCNTSGASVGPLVSFASEINQLGINVSRNTVDHKPTFADARTIKKLADIVENVTVGFLGDESNATGFWSLIWTALQGATEVYFEANLKVGATSATNPKFRGFITPSDVDAGGTVAESKWGSKTWPAHNITMVTV